MKSDGKKSKIILPVKLDLGHINTTWGKLWILIQKIKLVFKRSEHLEALGDIYVNVERKANQPEVRFHLLGIFSMEEKSATSW